MTRSRRSRTRARIRAAGLLVVVAASAAAIDDQLLAASPPAPTAAPRVHERRRALDPALADALRQATTDAAHDGIEIVVESGWRSPQHQELLLREAVATYGSEAEAARWVATPETSPHVSGDAVDVAPEATAWLSEHGAAYGLCQIYDNEPWHYELRPDAVDRGCPPTYPDPTHDPRMHR